MNKKITKTYFKNAICLVLVFVLAFVPVNRTPAAPVVGAVKAGVKLTVGCAKWTVVSSDKELCWLLYALADVTRCDTLRDVADWLKIEKKEDKKHDEIMASLNEIKDMISELQHEMNDLANTLNNSISILGAKADSKNLSDARSNLAILGVNTALAMSRYEAYLSASEAYGAALDKYAADPSEANKKAKQDAADAVTLRIKEFLDRAKIIDFENVISTLSIYSTNNVYTYNVSNKKVSARNNSVKSALYYANIFADDVYAFEHMKYQFLRDELNWENGLFAYVMQVNNVWVEFLEYYKSLPKDERRMLDPSLSLDNRNLQQEADELEAVLNIGYSCINDISEQFGKCAGTLMRPGDINAKVSMDYKATSVYDDRRWGTFGTFDMHHVSYAKTTTNDMNFYKVKPLKDKYDRTFLILKNGKNGPKTDADLVYFDSVKADINPLNVAYYSGMTTDFFNMGTTKAKDYRMPSNYDEFNSLINPSGFAVAGNDMLNYLVNFGGLDKSNLPPKLDIGLLNDWEKAPSQPKLTTKTAHFYSQYRAMDLNKYNATAPKESVRDIKAERIFNYGALATMVGKPRSEENFFFHSWFGYDRIKLSPEPYTDPEDNRKYYVPGTMVTLTYTPPKDFNKTLAVVDINGNVIEVLLEKEGYEAAKKADGSVELVFATAYQPFYLQEIDSAPTKSNSLSAMSMPDTAVTTESRANDFQPDTTGEFSVNLNANAQPQTFTDIAGHPLEDDISFVNSWGLLAGDGKGRYMPDSSMTRGMLTTVLAKLAGADVSSYRGSNFSDISTKSWLRPYAEWAYKNGIVQGHGNWQFKPDEPVTREQMAVIITKFAEKAGITMPTSLGDSGPYNDHESIGEWAAEAVYAIRPSGIMKEEDGFLFNPKGTVTRAEGASMLARFIRAIPNN